MKLLVQLIKLPLHKLIVDTVDNEILKLSHASTCDLKFPHQIPIREHLRPLCAICNTDHFKLFQLIRLQIDVSATVLHELLVVVIGEQLKSSQMLIIFPQL